MQAEQSFKILKRFEDRFRLYPLSKYSSPIFSPFLLVAHHNPEYELKSRVLVAKMLAYEWFVIFPCFSMFFPDYLPFSEYFFTDDHHCSWLRRFLAANGVLFKKKIDKVPVGFSVLTRFILNKLCGLVDSRSSFYSCLAPEKFLWRIFFFIQKHFRRLHHSILIEESYPFPFSWWILSLRNFEVEFRSVLGKNFSFNDYVGLFPSRNVFASTFLLITLMFHLRNSSGMFYYWNLVHNQVLKSVEVENTLPHYFFPRLVLTDVYRHCMLPQERHFRLNSFKEFKIDESDLSS